MQALTKFALLDRDDAGKLWRVPFSRLDTIAASELLRDVELLTPARG